MLDNENEEIFSFFAIVFLLKLKKSVLYVSVLQKFTCKVLTAHTL